MSGTSAWWNTIIIILYFVIERSSAYYFPWVESNGRVFYRQLTSNITRRRHTTYIVCSIIKALSNTHSTMISRGINFSSAHLKKMLTFPYRTVVVICLLQLQHERKKKNIRTNRAAYTIDLRRAIFIHVKRSEHTYIYSYIFRFVLPPIASLCWAYTLRLECITHIALPACFYTNANESLLCIYAPLYTYLFGIKCMWLVRFCCTQMHMRCGRINSNKKNVGCRILQTYCSVKWLQAQNTHSENIYMEYISLSVDTGKINYKKKIVCLVPLLFA